MLRLYAFNPEIRLRLNILVLGTMKKTVAGNFGG